MPIAEDTRQFNRLRGEAQKRASRVRSTRLLGCPWCGREPFVEKWHGGGPLKTRVTCDNPYCPANPSVCQSTKAAAVRLWNNRQPN